LYLPPIRMLVADDSAAVQAFFKDLADRSPMPIEVTAASTGTECLNLLSRGGFNLAFVNVNLPELSGNGGARAGPPPGRQDVRGVDVREGPDERLDLARQLNAYEYLVKPFTAADVNAILKTYKQVMVRMATLIVDDSRTIRRVIRQVLESACSGCRSRRRSMARPRLQRFQGWQLRYRVSRLCDAGIERAGNARRHSDQSSQRPR